MKQTHLTSSPSRGERSETKSSGLDQQVRPGYLQSRHYFVLALVLAGFLWATYEQGLILVVHQRLAALAVLSFGVGVVARYGIPVRLTRPAVLALLVYLAGYVISLPFAATPIEAVPGLVFMVASAFAFLLGAWAARFRDAVPIAADMVAIIGGFAAGIGLLIYAQVMVSEEALLAGRLGSTFQYANVQAAVVMMGAIAALGGGRAKLGWRHVVLFTCLLALLLTGSRGGMLAAAVALVGYCVTALNSQPFRIALLAGHGAFALATFALLQRPDLWPQVFKGSSLTIILMGMVVAVAVLAMADGLVARLRLTRAQLRIIAIGVVGVTGAIAGYVLLQSDTSFLGRFVDFSRANAFGDRPQHLRDALNVILDHPLGLGYRGWWAIYPQYQGFGYIINIIHSHPMETAVSAGLIGLVGLLGLWLTAGVNYLRRAWSADTHPAWHGLFWSLAALGLHSVVDADMNFLIFTFMAAAGWGILEGFQPYHPTPQAQRRGKQLVAVVGMLLFLVLGSMMLGDALNNQAGEIAAGDFEAARAKLRQAMVFNPVQPLIHRNAAALYQTYAQQRGDEELRQVAQRELERMVALDPLRPDFHKHYGAFLAEQGDIGAAAAEFERTVALAPWRTEYWETLLQFRIKAAKAYRDAGMTAEFQEHLRAAQEILPRMSRLQATLPPDPYFQQYGLVLNSNPLTELKQELQALQERP